MPLLNGAAAGGTVEGLTGRRCEMWCPGMTGGAGMMGGAWLVGLVGLVLIAVGVSAVVLVALLRRSGAGGR